MKKKLICAVLALCMVVSLLPLGAFAEDDTIVIHVSTTGRGSATGSAESPYKTIEAARDAIRKINHKKKKVEVLIHGGEYKITKGIAFDESDSGSADFPVVYKAAGDGEVIVSGSTTLDLTKFTNVTDKSVYNRIPASSRDKVAQMSLEEYNIPREVIEFASQSWGAMFAPNVPTLYFNDLSQDLSRYPNSGFLSMKTVLSANPQGVFKYETLNPEKWKNAKYALICGFLGTEYAFEWAKMDKVDTDNKTIHLKTATVYGIKPGRRWFAQNLIEELDCPGEYYIDPDTTTLYYYPTKKFNASDRLELTTLNGKMMALSKVKHVTFEGISFRHNLTHGVTLSSCENVTFRKCEFIDLGKWGVTISGKNNLVEACRFRDIGTHAVNLNGGGDYDTYTYSNNKVSNCHFWNCSCRPEHSYNTVISMGRNSSSASIGDVVENNLIHAQSYSGAIIYGDLESTIRYNEIWEFKREAADAGLIYAGKRLNEWGHVQEYNYIHDFGIPFNAQYTVVGIYWDDTQSGQTSKHNIIVGNNKNKTSGNLDVGAFNTNAENIYVNLNTGVAHSDRNATESAESTNSISGPKATPAVYAKWPQMPQLKAAMDEYTIFPVINNVVRDNLNVDVNMINVSQIEGKGNNVVENNPITDDYSVFVDAKNHDYRLTTAAMEKYGFPETMINEKNFDMDMIGIQKDVWDIEAPNAETSPFRLLYPTNGQTNVSRNGAFIKWEKALYSDQFDYVVATDPELKNVVEKGTTYYNFAELKNLENDKTYYYKVYAKNFSKQIGSTWESLGVPYMFTTAKYDTLDKTFLNIEIEKLEEARKQIVPGDKIGDFRPDALEKVDTLLAEAKSMAALTKGDQGMLDEMTYKVRTLVNGIGALRYSGHVATDINAEWNYDAAKVGFTQSDGSVKFDAITKDAIANLKEKASNNEIQHFKMKIDSPNWITLALRQADLNILPYKNTNKSYVIIIKQNLIEVQKYNAAAAKTGILQEIPNTFIKFGQWHDIEFAALDVDGGVEVFMKVDGKEVFRLYDTESPITEPGYFTVYQCNAGGNIELKMADADSVPKEFYEFSPESIEDDKEKIYDHTADIFSSTGTWSDGPATGYDNKAIRVSKEPTASADYKITDQLAAYHLSYYHTPYANADKNEKMNVTFYTTTAAGNRTITKTIDFTQGEAGWVDIGSFECLSASTIGTIEVTFTGSGEGEIVAPVIRARKVEGDEIAFSRLFYDSATNLLMMQIDNQQAFNMMTPVEIPDVAPMIDNSRTMVPLRFVSEAFGANVTWDGDARQVHIVNGDTNLVFTIDSATYTVNGEAKQSDAAAKIVNGRTMVPLRVTAESLGKQVYWNNAHRMIFIADSFAFQESDSAKFDLAAKGFKGEFNK